MTEPPKKKVVFYTDRERLLNDASGYLSELEAVRPYVNEQGRIAEFAGMYAQAYIAKIRLTPTYQLRHSAK